MTEDQTLVGRPFEGVRLSIKHEEIFIDTPYHVEGVSLPYSLKDRGRIDEQGRLHFLGRTDDICNVNGIKVSCKRIAGALERLPAVEQAVVLGRHEADADVLTAYLVTQRKYGKQELLSLLRHSLESYEMPKRFVLLAELPLNESGKPDLCRLRELGERG
jgi:long-chain acyl-CoA synthetase